MNARLCLIDGTYELFRAFYSAPPTKTEDGFEIGATLALARSFSKLVASGEFSHFAVSFDTVIESFRNQLFEGYKTGEGIEPALHAQFPFAEEASRSLGLFTLSMIDFEADDGLCTLAAHFEASPEVEAIVIASPDKDLMQCVRGERITTWDRVRDVRYDRAGVMAKMGVFPESIPDYLALVGDTADGIPGVPRFGAKSAGALLAHYGTLESIPRNETEWAVSVRGAAALGTNLRASEKEMALYKVLATLRQDALPLPPLDALLCRPDPEKLTAFERKLGRPLVKARLTSEA